MSSAYDSIISKWSGIFDVPFALIKAIVAQESNFNPKAKNPGSSASGLMQLITDTATWMNNNVIVPATDTVGGIFNPDTNVSLGTKYLSMLMQRNGGNMEKTVADYYAGTAYKDESGRWYRISHGSRNYDVNTYVQHVMEKYQKYSGSSVSPVAPDSPLPPLGNGSGTTGIDTSIILLGLFVGALLFKRILRRKDDNAKK